MGFRPVHDDEASNGLRSRSMALGQADGTPSDEKKAEAEKTAKKCGESHLLAARRVRWPRETM